MARNSTLLSILILLAVAVGPMLITGQSCLVGPSAFAYPIPLEATDGGSYGMCKPGWYCPNSDRANRSTWPSICPPTDSCIKLRLGNRFCEAQGLYEPVPCPAGWYCPNAKLKLRCPEGYACILGSTTPQKCGPFSRCPEGTANEYEMTGVFIVALVDVAVLVAGLLYRQLTKVPSLQDPEGHRAIALSASSPTLAGSSTTAASPVQLMSPAASARFTNSQLEAQEKMFSFFQRARGTEAPLTFECRELFVSIPNAQPKSGSNGAAQSQTSPKATDNVEEQMTEVSSPQANAPAGSTEKVLLAGVTGSFKPGRVTAVMGPSGAGKTILLSTVLDKLNSAWTKKGTFHVNGQYSTQDVRSALGFVPQDDVLHTDLTVQENLYFSSETRLPSSWTASERQEVRELVVQALGLDFVRHVRVGDELTRGISGGQRKRCSIGLELCAMPSALFLDEPTTGLDASTALDLCHLLKRLAEGANLTIGMVIHQPRVEIWEALDELLILAPGGRTVYQGPQRLAQQYFDEVLGLDFSYGNPADIILDGVAANPGAAVEAWNTRLEKGGPSPRSVEAAAVASQQTNESNVNNSQPPAFVVHDDEPEAQHAGERRGSSAWKSPEPANADANNNTSRANSNSSTNEPVQVQPETDGVKKENDTNVVGTAVPDRSGASFFRQVLLAHNRNLMKQYSRWHTLVLDISLGMIASTLMGAAALRDSYIGVVRSEYILLGPKMKIFLVPMLAMFYMLSIASSVAAAGIRTFGSEQPQYWREASAGHNRLAYFIGYTLGDLYRLVLGALHFSLIAYVMWEPVQGYGSFFLILFLVFLNVDSQSALLSMFLRPDSAPLLSTVIAVFMGLLNGYPGIPLINPVSYAWWSTEAFLTKNVMPLTSIYSTKVLNDNWGYKLDQFGFDIGMLVLYFFLYRIGAFLLMICLNREKQR